MDTTVVHAIQPVMVTIIGQVTGVLLGIVSITVTVERLVSLIRQLR